MIAGVDPGMGRRGGTGLALVSRSTVHAAQTVRGPGMDPYTGRGFYLALGVLCDMVTQALEAWRGEGHPLDLVAIEEFVWQGRDSDRSSGKLSSATAIAHGVMIDRVMRWADRAGAQVSVQRSDEVFHPVNGYGAPRPDNALLARLDERGWCGNEHERSAALHGLYGAGQTALGGVG
jgi:hypothetical protein